MSFSEKKKKRRTTNPTKPTPTERMLYLEGSGSWSVAFYQLPTAERASGSSQKWTHYSCREQVPAATAGLLPTLQPSLPAPTGSLISHCLLGLLGCFRRKPFPTKQRKGHLPCLNFLFCLLSWDFRNLKTQAKRWIIVIKEGGGGGSSCRGQWLWLKSNCVLSAVINTGWPMAAVTVWIQHQQYTAVI